MRAALFCGFGWAARRLWLPALVADGFHTFGVFDHRARPPDPLPGVRFHHHDTLDDLDRYDVAVVASPNASHADLAARLLENGLRVVVEKPVCVALLDLRVLEAAAARGGVGLLRSCSTWYDPHFTRFRDLVRARASFEPRRVRARWTRRDGIPSSPWQTRSEYALAGSSIDLGWHLLECVMAMAGWTPLTPERARFHLEPGAHTASWYGEGSVHLDRIDVDTASSVSLRSETGLTVEMDTAWCSRSDGDVVEIEVEGDGGRYRLTTLFGMSDAAARAPLMEVTENGRTYAEALPAKPRGAAHALMAHDFVAKKFDPERVGQTWEQLRALTATTEAIVRRHETWRRELRLGQGT
ncbi:MAG: Gfo/Idh/MocA family oxidoreductase [Microbispora sp.]|nr:Gfo/Idh/MocA family oxidoreductase [Microbispora sp.]